ncbi:unnamed protein product [Paramecium pentaurelia]|uniref:Uncharacterized protein n=1 Tax=Paramecium pentaurelia TaxID=43138 RepID=A0A8S1X3H5_9CILI|nr:unnamed protein product [Paramecium pentaurelia]
MNIGKYSPYGKLTEEETRRRIVEQLALPQMYKLRIVHRDFKLTNILYQVYNIIKVSNNLFKLLWQILDLKSTWKTINIQHLYCDTPLIMVRRFYKLNNIMRNVSWSYQLSNDLKNISIYSTQGWKYN